eukprot:6374455-Amphidinium_carterae.1
METIGAIEQSTMSPHVVRCYTVLLMHCSCHIVQHCSISSSAVHCWMSLFSFGAVVACARMALVRRA